MRKTWALLGILCFSVSLPARTDNLFQKKLSKDQQILHALDRLSFGPRPGDLEAVQKLGLRKWIDLQLHPERIRESQELERRLQPLETLRLTQKELVAKYPPPQLIRAIARGVQKPPEDPIARAAVERLTQRFNLRRDQPDDQPLEPRTPLAELLTSDQIRTLRSGTPEQRRELLGSLPEDTVEAVVVALAPRMRNQLLPVATPELRRKMMLANNPQQVVAADLSESKVYRAIYSNRQLQEELVDFWFNHFNVYLDKGADRFLVTGYERDAIRPHVLGKFRDLLEATSASPAMLFYLDNWQSVAPGGPADRARPLARLAQGKQAGRGLNENYARELMELHTLGVDGGYTQKDIVEVARCFTGWTIDRPNLGGSFRFNERTHDRGEKVVLGVRIPAGGGREDGEKVLDILSRHPSTAKFIAKKLAQRFVADDPPAELIEQMARIFLQTDGDLRAVMEAMVSSKEFFSQGAWHAKVKTPFEMIVSAVRATGAEVDFAMPLVNQIANLGQPLYRKLEPTGYSAVNADWVNSAALLARMNFALQLGQNRVPGIQLDTARFDSSAPAVARQVLFADPSAQTLRAIENAIEEQRQKNPQQPPSGGTIAGLVIGSPDFQRR